MANKHMKKYNETPLFTYYNNHTPKCWQYQVLVRIWINRNWSNVKWKSLSRSDSLQPHELYSPLNSPAQNNGVGSLSLLQGIFLTQGSNPGLPHCSRFFTSWATREVHRNMCSLLVGMQNGTTTLQNRSEFSYKTKYVLTVWFRNHTLWYLTKWIENVCPSAQKFYSSLYVISETWKQPKCSSVGKWIDKMWYETMEFKD